MTKQVDIKVVPGKVDDELFILQQIRKKLKINPAKEVNIRLVKRSIDARGPQVLYLLRHLVDTEKEPVSDADTINIKYQLVDNSPVVVIVGAGPAGYFAALECLELGLKPIVLDRGKDVRTRRRDLRAIQQFGEVNPHSNYCFGEGGAGTYSDGKLYTRSKKRGNIIKTLKVLVNHGANEDILIDAHPHIGSNKLPGIISNIRATIEKFGGEVRFDAFVKDFDVIDTNCKAAILEGGERVEGNYFILATGHSARDIFKLFEAKKWKIEPKPFAIGVRVEHPQGLIDSIQYNQDPRHPNLPASSYKLVCQVQGNGVFSFCMCPGGLIVPAATAPGEIVVNGMSLSRRDSPYANSGVVTSVSTEELQHLGYSGPLGNMEFQAEVEQTVFNYGDGSQKAPAQNLIDFCNANMMLPLNETSYIPGLIKAPLHELLPEFVYHRLRDGILQFALKMDGYFTDQANVVAVESRTSSPVRIPRDRTTCQHPQINNLYPCGEGAGYAGGILSAAMDGQRVVKAFGA